MDEMAARTTPLRMPNMITPAKEIIAMPNSMRLIFQSRFSPMISNRLLIATSSMAAKTTSGKFFNLSVRNSRHKAMVTDAKISENGDLAPASTFTADWERPPVTG